MLQLGRQEDLAVRAGRVRVGRVRAGRGALGIKLREAENTKAIGRWRGIVLSKLQPTPDVQARTKASVLPAVARTKDQQFHEDLDRVAKSLEDVLALRLLSR